MFHLIYELRKNWRGTGGRVGTSKVLQEVLADLKRTKDSFLANLSEIEKQFQKLVLKSGAKDFFCDKALFSLILTRKPLFKGQNRLLRPHLTIILGILVLKSGLRVLFQAP